MDQEERSFIKETIKEKPMTGRKRLSIGIQVAAAGAIFGAAACLVFYMLSPWAQTHLNKEDAVIIQDDLDPDDPVGTDADDPAVLSELDAEHYALMMHSISRLESDINRSVALITGSDPIDESSEEKAAIASTHSVSGLLIAETNSYLLFLLPMDKMTGYNTYTMSFGVGNACSGKIRCYDTNVNLGILEVPKSEIDGYLSSYYRVAVLGNSYAIEKGTPILAMGDLYGIENSMALGLLSSRNGTTDIIDADMALLISDIPGSSNSSGIFANLKGEILGIIMPDQKVSGSSALTALSISEVKDVIEHLSNRILIPYTGITGTAIDSATAEKLDLSEGIYVTDIRTDSPAMDGGLQIGDIIESVNGTSVNSMDAYHNVLMNERVGAELTIRGKRATPDGLEKITLHITISYQQ